MKTALPGLLEVMVVRWYVTMLGCQSAVQAIKHFGFMFKKKIKPFSFFIQKNDVNVL